MHSSIACTGSSWGGHGTGMSIALPSGALELDWPHVGALAQALAAASS